MSTNTRRRNDYASSHANRQHINKVGNEIIEQMYKLVGASTNIFEDKQKILDSIEEMTTQQLDSQIDILRMTGETEKALNGCDSMINDIHHRIKRLTEYIEEHLVYRDMKVIIPFVSHDIYENVHPEHKKNTYIVPYGTTHLISFEMVNTKQSFESFIQSKIDYFKDFTEVDETFENKIRQICKKYYNDIGIVSTFPIRMVLPKTLTHIDESIFSWIRGVNEIECYEHQLEEVEKAIEFNKKQIESRKDSLRRLFKLDNTDELTALEDITVIVLD